MMFKCAMNLLVFQLPYCSAFSFCCNCYTEYNAKSELKEGNDVYKR